MQFVTMVVECEYAPGLVGESVVDIPNTATVSEFLTYVSTTSHLFSLPPHCESHFFVTHHPAGSSVTDKGLSLLKSRWASLTPRCVRVQLHDNLWSPEWHPLSKRHFSICAEHPLLFACNLQTPKKNCLKNCRNPCLSQVRALLNRRNFSVLHYNVHSFFVLECVVFINFSFIHYFKLRLQLYKTPLLLYS